MTNAYKSPEEVLDYTFDWTQKLQAVETISSASVTVDPLGPTISQVTHDTKTVTFWVAGGTTNVDYTLTCQIATNQGRTFHRHQLLYVKEVKFQ